MEKKMKAILRYGSLFFLALLLVACGPSAEEVAATYVAQTAEAATDTPEPTATNTPTLTPSPTMTPTIEPPSVAVEYLDGVEIIYTDNFDTFKNWSVWNSQTVNSDDGVVEIVGQQNWEGALVQDKKLHENMGIMIEFKNTSGSEYEFVTNTGNWDTDSFRSFGVYGGNSPKADLWQGKNALGGNYLHGNIALKKDSWYGMMIAIDDEGEFFAIVWDIDSPARQAIYHERINERWIGKTWEFLIQTNTGTTVFVDNFLMFSFNAVK
jgi:hypothetical protein